MRFLSYVGLELIGLEFINLSVWGLKILNRVRVNLRFYDAKIGAGVAQNARHELHGKLLALVMPQGGDKYLIVVTKELVIPHFTCQKGVGATLYGLTQQEVARTATQCNFANGASG